MDVITLHILIELDQDNVKLDLHVNFERRISHVNLDGDKYLII